MAATTLARTERERGEPVRTNEYDRRAKLFNRVCLGVLISCAILWLIPLAWAVDTALKPNAETTKVTWAIDNPTFAAFARVFQETDMLNWYVSSFITSLLTALTVVVTGSMAAFALSRMRFRYKNFVFWFILIGIMIPGQVLIVPHFREFDIMNLLNTYWAVILPQAPTAIAVFIFKQFFDGLPRDLDDAAKVDGASYFRLYRTVAMPLARPAAAAVAIFTFVTTWNDFLGPMIYLTKTELKTIQIGLRMFISQYSAEYGLIMAASVVALIPVLIVFLALQRFFVEGVASSGIKG